MGGINVASHMAKKSIVRDLNGQIISMLDENGGGWIVRNRQVVNQDLWNAHIQKEIDKREAAKAMSHAVAASPEAVAARSGVAVPVGKVDELEKKVNDMDSKLNAILEALKK